MVKPVILSLWLLISTLPLLAEVAQKTPDYQPGDTALEDVVTPISLIVIDPKATDALRQKEAQRVPAIFRFDPTIVDDAELLMNKTFTNVQKRFMKDLKTAFQKKKLTDQDFA